MIEFALPSLGADMDEGTLLSWLVKPGDTVRRGQVVAVVDTSKAAVDVEIWQSGTVVQLLVAPGEKVPVGAVLARLLAPGEAGAGAAPQPSPQLQPQPMRAAVPVPLPAPEPEAAPVAAPALSPEPPRPAPPIAPRPTTMPAPGAALLDAAAVAAAAARRPVSPAARQRARALGIDPDTLAGTGPQGAVSLADIEAAGQAQIQAPSSLPSKSPASAPAPAPTAIDRQKAMRKAIAAAMSRAKREIPHYYLSESIPMAAALSWLQQRNAGMPITERVLPAALLLKAVALALTRTPELNGFFRDGESVPSSAVHLGVAISLRGGGLVAPALHDVPAKPLAQLMAELADLVRRARAGSLRSSEMSDPTLTVTNLGDQGVDAVSGVIYPPQVALVGLGRIAERAWAQDGWIRAMPVMTASLAADHRVSDGHRGALFLAELRDRLQHPDALDPPAG